MATITSPPRPVVPRPPGPRPWWAWGLAVLSVLSVVALVGTAVGVAVSALSQRNASGVVAAEDVTTVRLSAVSAAVTIVGDDTVDGVSGEWSTRSSLVDTGVRSTVRDGVMVIVVDCPPSDWFGPECQAGLTLRVPPATRLELDLEAAAVTGSSLAGDIDVSVNAGSVRFTGLSSRSIRAANNAGEVELRFDAPPETVIASTNIGTVTVAVPDDATTYAVTTSSNVGDDSSDVPNDVDSGRSINASTNVGEVRVTTGTSSDGASDSPGQRGAPGPGQ